jgi:hypothetical protein
VITWEKILKLATILLLTNQLRVMVDRCKRYCERLMRANGLDDSIRHNYEGKLLAVCQKHDFKETARRMGHAHFTSTHHTFCLVGLQTKMKIMLPADTASLFLP